MEKAQIFVGVTHTRILLQNEIEKNYIKNVVISMSLKLNRILNKDSNYVQNNCA
ncbi:MAG: hypothetical protein J6N78_05005 [Clostridia bacterium]|nr:hypothetical protein [Clostridia bacterium]